MVVKLTVTDQDIHNLLVEAAQREKCSLHTTASQTQWTIPEEIGKGYGHYINLCKGLTINIFDGQFWRPMINKKNHQKKFPIVAKFYLSGGIRIKTDNVPEIVADYEEIAGHNYIYHLPELAELEECPSDINIQTVRISADAHYLSAINLADELLPNPLQRLMQAKRFHQPLGKTTLAMTQVLQQILHCPYQGATQQLYLESKALELLALQFACLDADTMTYDKSPLKAADLERVRYARDILGAKLSSSLSMVELSRQVGLNEQTLRQGFRHLFGTTVFGYLRDCRMEHAQCLLRQSDITVAEVAHQVGYRSPEAFSTAFRRQFSISPKAYQLGKRA